MKKLVAIICTVMLISAAAVSASAADDVSGELDGAGDIMTYAGENTGDFTVTGGTYGTDYTYANHVLTIKSGTPMTISSHSATTDGATHNDRIEVDAYGIEVDLTFENLKINRGGNSTNSAAFKINAAQKVTITLEGENLLASTDGFAGLQNNSIPLEIKGTGLLDAEGGYLGAGIGGGNGYNGEHITICESARVEAKGYNGGAGIGGGYGGSGNDIKIIGSAQVTASGSVTESSSIGGAGIGGGWNGGANSITIKDSAQVTANSYIGGAGIGGGKGGNGEKIYIYSGTVNATGIGGAGIGGGDGGNGESIYIYGGTVNAYGGYWGYWYTEAQYDSYKVNLRTRPYIFGGGAGIGGGRGGSGSDIEISGGEVTAKGTIGAGIGGGGGTEEDRISNYNTFKYGGNGENIRILGGNVTAECESQTMDPAAGYKRYGNSAGIGGGSSGNAKDIIITTDGKVDATGGNNGGAGIGGGQYYSDSYYDYTGGPPVYVPVYAGGNADNIEIGGSGTIIATAYKGPTGSGSGGGAGIGGGMGGNATNITIDEDSDVTIIATGPTGGAGIGGGQSVSYSYNDYTNGGTSVTKYVGGNATGITINGGERIEATGGSGGGAGIGGGSDGSGGAEGDGNGIYISGSANIIAQSSNGAGIGGGSGGNGSNITIDSGTITATGNAGAGIGGGQSSYYTGTGGNGSGITINGGTIIATSSQGAGIGGGQGPYSTGTGGNGSGITINGGDITTTSSMGAGIGGGYSGSGTGIKISGGETVVNAQNTQNAAGIGAGYNGGNAEVEISGGNINANGFMGAGIGGGSTKTDITISGGSVTAISDNPYTNTMGIGIGSSGGGTTIIINEDNEDKNTTTVIAVGKVAGINANGEGSSVEITGGTVTTVYEKTNNDGTVTEITPNGSGISGTTVKISGNDTEITAESTNGVGINGTTIEIEQGTVTANGGNGAPGIYGTDVYIGVEDKTTSTSYPWVFTNKITSKNGNDDYYGIVFDENHKNEYVADEPDADKESCNSDDPKKVYGADGVVYGRGKEIELTEEYILESGKVLRVQGGVTQDGITQSGATFKTENMLTLEAGSILYIEKGADLDKYDKITYEGEGDNRGRVLHEAESVYVEVTNEDGKTKKLCTLCGSETDHAWKTDWVCSKTHHWHECEKNTDCSIHEYRIDLCNITENKDKDGYGEHVFVKTRSNNIVTFTCECGYSYSVVIPEISIYKVDSDAEPLPGAKFRLYSNADCTEQVGEEVTAAKGTVDGETKAAAVFTTDIEVDTLYYIKETEAPDGYKKSDKVYTVKVTAELDGSGEPDEPVELPVDPPIIINGKAVYGVVGFADTSENIPVCKNYDINAIIPDPAKIMKVDGETGTPLAGARFGIYSDAGCTNLITTGTTAISADNKAVVSFDTELNKTYYIKETKAPDGYKVSEEVYKAVVDADGKVTYSVAGSETTLEEIPVCKNYAVKVIIPDPAKVIKVDGETGTPLAGAQFGIYSDAGCTNLITTGTTAIGADNKAVVSFDTELNRTYYIKETKAPDGYKVSEEVYRVVVDADGKVTYSVVGSETTLQEIPVCKNYAVKVIIPDPAKVIKVDGETGAPLAGAQFGIYNNAECTSLITIGTTAIGADNNAVVSFTTEPNKAYYIKETKAPDGYKISDEVYRTVVDANGKVTYSVVGSETTMEEIPVCRNYAVKVTISDPVKIIKVDGETGAPLAGARFGLYSDAECTVLLTTGNTIIGVDNKAVVTFATEPNRVYYIRENAAPDGYKVSDVVFKAVVDANGKVTYGVAGSQTISEAIPVCKNEKTADDDTSVSEDTPSDEAHSPATGDTGGFATAGIAILSGITCAASLMEGAWRRKRKNSEDDDETDFESEQ